MISKDGVDSVAWKAVASNVCAVSTLVEVKAFKSIFSLVVVAVASIKGSLDCKLFISIFVLISEPKVFISVAVVVCVSIIGSEDW